MVAYNRLLAMPWDGLNTEQKAESLQLAFRAGDTVGMDRAANHNDRAATTYEDFDLFLLQDPEFNEDGGGGDDQPIFMNEWKPNYWASVPNDLRVAAFIVACDEAKNDTQ